MGIKHNDTGERFVPPSADPPKPPLDPEVEAAYAEYRKLPPEVICPWDPTLTIKDLEAMDAEGGWMTFDEVKRRVGMS